MTREGRGRPWVAVNHIRDQLIPPANRARYSRIWSKAVDYVRHSESRVREDVQHVFGEEHKVWQWIPDIHWSPMGPHPYMRPPSSPPVSISPPMSLQSSPAPTSSPHWQGAAFATLNKNVASPTIAPTSCLKIRHLFDAKKTGVSGWEWQVKEEILRRCGQHAKIMHVAIDKESPEGCVYVKASCAEDAGFVFKSLHGQWFKGNLVTVKYVREGEIL